MAAQPKVRVIRVFWLGSNVRVLGFKFARETTLCDAMSHDCEELYLCQPRNAWTCIRCASVLLETLVERLSCQIDVAPGDIKLMHQHDTKQDFNIIQTGRFDKWQTTVAWTKLLTATSPKTPLRLFVTRRSNVDLAVNKLQVAIEDRGRCENEFAQMSVALRNNIRVARVAIKGRAFLGDVGPLLRSNKAFMTDYVCNDWQIVRPNIKDFE